VNRHAQDLLWPHFMPLLTSLNDVAGHGILVAGGYGLYLKQNWLLANPYVPVIIPVGQWRDNTPRVTKDIDFVIGLDLIAEEDTQRNMVDVLKTHGFMVSERHPRWQFVKTVSANRNIIVELHAPLPEKGMPGLKADKMRVKRNPSMGNAGIHGRTNPQAIGCDYYPFAFEWEGLSITVPNPVTWSMMKLTAAQDRWAISRNPNQTEEHRAFSRVQAIKHAQDACRVVAMVTRGENEAITSVLDSIRPSPEFRNAVRLFSESFADDEQWFALVLANDWTAENFSLIRSTLATWFADGQA
jgi:hypothetical protein